MMCIAMSVCKKNANKQQTIKTITLLSPYIVDGV